MRTKTPLKHNEETPTPSDHLPIFDRLLIEKGREARAPHNPNYRKKRAAKKHQTDPWNKKDDAKLRKHLHAQKTLEEIAIQMERSTIDIRQRLAVLGIS